LERPIPFSALLFDTLSDSSIPGLLAGAPADVVVLERIARGAGATRWFVLHDPEELGVLVSRLSPGSSVSFYFDGRLAASRYDLSVRSELLAIAELDGDAVIGRLGVDQIELDVEFVAGPAELEEYESQLLPWRDGHLRALSRARQRRGACRDRRRPRPRRRRPTSSPLIPAAPSLLPDGPGSTARRPSVSAAIVGVCELDQDCGHLPRLGRRELDRVAFGRDGFDRNAAARV
jgi:hypothetical protein